MFPPFNLDLWFDFNGMSITVIPTVDRYVGVYPHPQITHKPAQALSYQTSEETAAYSGVTASEARWDLGNMLRNEGCW